MRSKSFLMELTEEEMLEMWKLRVGLMPARRDCTVEREDGLDLDGKLLVDIKQWYAQLLATGPVEWLPVEDVSGDVTAESDSTGVITAVMPDRCVRPVSWHVAGWAVDVTRFEEPDSVVARQQSLEWLRGGGARPVAVLREDAVLLYTTDSPEDFTIDKALCVVRPDDGSYQFSQEALATIPNGIAG